MLIKFLGKELSYLFVQLCPDLILRYFPFMITTKLVEREKNIKIKMIKLNK